MQITNIISLKPLTEYQLNLALLEVQKAKAIHKQHNDSFPQSFFICSDDGNTWTIFFVEPKLKYHYQLSFSE